MRQIVPFQIVILSDSEGSVPPNGHLMSKPDPSMDLAEWVRMTAGNNSFIVRMGRNRGIMKLFLHTNEGPSFHWPVEMPRGSEYGHQALFHTSQHPLRGC